MGRTLCIRAFLVFLICFLPRHNFVVGNAVGASPAPAMADNWDELETWLHELCYFVHCDLTRLPSDGPIPQEDLAALQLVLSYETYGIRADLSKADYFDARLITSYCLKLLDQGPTKLDPEVERLLEDALVSLEVDLGT